MVEKTGSYFQFSVKVKGEHDHVVAPPQRLQKLGESRFGTSRLVPHGKTRFRSRDCNGLVIF